MPEASIIFLSYNQAEYVADALVSALDQASADFEIIVADDGSTDSTLEVINEVLRNHPKAYLVKYLPNQTNQGMVKNWNRAIEAATGKIIIAQAGDDISRPDRVAVTLKRFHEFPSLMALFSQVDVINEKGVIIRKGFERGRPVFTMHQYTGGIDGFDFWKGAPVLGASGSYRMTLARQFDPLQHALSEDQPYVYRALLLGAVGFEPNQLVQWRWHGLNLSIGGLFDENEGYESLRKRARMYYARYEAANQYQADVRHAFRCGMIDSIRFNREMLRIRAIKAIEKLGQLSVDPSADMRDWARSAIDVIRYNRLSWRTIGYVARNFIKRNLPLYLKLKATRPLR